MIDQINLSIELTILKNYQNLKSFRTWDSGERRSVSCDCHFVFCFIVVIHLFVQQGCYPFVDSFVVKVCYRCQLW